MKKKQSLIILATLLLLSCSGAAYAKDIVLDKVIVSARGTDSSQSQTPGGTGLVEKEDIMLAPRASVADSIARIPGLAKTGESPWGKDITIRGLSGSSVIILIDGMRVNTATELNARLGFINPLEIERVEVLKGPVSSLYGSGSIGGVVNILTKKGHFSQEMEGHGELIASWSTNPQGPDGYARANISNDRFWFQLSGALRDHDDYYGGGHDRVANSQFNDSSVRIAGEARWTDKLSTLVQFMNLEANEVGIPGGSKVMPKTAPITYPRSRNVLASMETTYLPDSDVFKKVLLNLHYMKNDRRVRIDKPALPIKKIAPEADHETVGGKLQAEFDFGCHTLITGVEAWNWHIVSTRGKYLAAGPILFDEPIPNSTQLSMGIFAEDDWQISPEFKLNLGARIDRNTVHNEDHAKFKESTNYNMGWNVHAGLTWQPVEHWSHTFLVASSYRAADILERFKNIQLGGGVTALGNPDLSPEKTYYFEYGAHYTTESLKASASAYANIITDYIEDKKKTATSYVMENIGQARIYGVELEADWHFAHAWNLYGNVALCHGRDEKNHEALRSVAPINGLAGIKYSMDNGFWVRLETPWSLRQSEVPEGLDRTNGWITVNTAAGYGFDWGQTRHEVSLAVDNLFDHRHKNYLANSRSIDLVDPGISASLNYRLTF